MASVVFVGKSSSFTIRSLKGAGHVLHISQESTFKLTETSNTFPFFADILLGHIHSHPTGGGTLSVPCSGGGSLVVVLGDKDCVCAGDGHEGLVLKGEAISKKIEAESQKDGLTPDVGGGDLVFESTHSVDTANAGRVIVSMTEDVLTLCVARKGVVFPQQSGPAIHDTHVTIKAHGYTSIEGASATTDDDGTLVYEATIKPDEDLTVTFRKPAAGGDASASLLAPPAAAGGRDEAEVSNVADPGDDGDVEEDLEGEV
ncbi:unnamed protein product [Vitrella brassicaformis CCMP3155]|uniref:Uncharacterized protein n=1 Tax=Vitrella brassicaformis (strain CCMP3155) TaxID=1169540 RepID=A0A0G4EW37_VITBC|nr:unnamed protein product [Vitrella brassicaformis CCMP3155]|eukprot:CEM02555.1 unnamed protein product [Vitrella brassicaformis CCMP3155]